MKSKSSYILLLGVLLCSISCATTKLTVKGAPGTVIYTTRGHNLGTIDQSGNAEIKIDRDNYYAFLLAQSPESNIKVPFALDFKKESVIPTIEEGLLYLGFSFFGAGAILTLVDFLVQKSLDEIGMVGLGTMAAGAAMYATSYSDYLGRHDRQNEYSYHKVQQTNNDLKLSLNKASTRPIIQTPTPASPTVDNKANTSISKSSEKKSQTNSSVTPKMGPKTFSHASKSEAIAAAKKAVQDYNGILSMRVVSVATGISAIDLYDGDKLVERHVYAE